jgi:hypothetical protein
MAAVLAPLIRQVDALLGGEGEDHSTATVVVGMGFTVALGALARWLVGACCCTHRAKAGARIAIKRRLLKDRPAGAAVAVAARSEGKKGRHKASRQQKGRQRARDHDLESRQLLVERGADDDDDEEEDFEDGQRLRYDPAIQEWEEEEAEAAEAAEEAAEAEEAEEAKEADALEDGWEEGLPLDDEEAVEVTGEDDLVEHVAAPIPVVRVSPLPRGRLGKTRQPHQSAVKAFVTLPGMDKPHIQRIVFDGVLTATEVPSMIVQQLAAELGDHVSVLEAEALEILYLRDLSSPPELLHADTDMDVLTSAKALKVGLMQPVVCI